MNATAATLPSPLSRLLAAAVLCAAAGLTSCRSSAPAPGPVPPAGGLAVRGRSADGAHVQLSDGSRWTVQPAGRSASVHWAAGYRLAVSRTGQADWPFVLVDPATRVIALARPE